MEKEFMENANQKFNDYDEQFKKCDKQFEKMHSRLSNHGKQFEEIHAHLADHDKQFEEIHAHLADHDKQFEEIHAHLADHDKQFEEIRQDLNEIKRSVLFMEEYITSKIPALFDAYLSHEQKNEEFDNRITNLEKNSDVNSLKISILEDTSKKHSSQLAKLSS